MKGQYRFKIRYRKLFFDFIIKRNITVLQGNSATGKTTLLEILARSLSSTESHGIHIDTNADYFVYLRNYSKKSWLEVLSDYTDTVIFIEEGNSFIYTHEFANFAATSGNYFVLVTRKPIKSLPYSTHEIYEIINTNDKLYQLYSFKELYSNFSEILSDFDLVITEDSNSGFQFFSNFFDTKVVSSNSNAKFKTAIEHFSESSNNILCIVDGATFGPYLENIIEITDELINKRVTIWMPESFECVLLKAGIISFNDLDRVLENPSEYIECSDYISWERFFTHLAEKYSDIRWKYTKGTLDSFYYNKYNVEKVKSVLPESLAVCKKSGINKMSLF